MDKREGNVGEGSSDQSPPSDICTKIHEASQFLVLGGLLEVGGVSPPRLVCPQNVGWSGSSTFQTVCVVVDGEKKWNWNWIIKVRTGKVYDDDSVWDSKKKRKEGERRKRVSDSVGHPPPPKNCRMEFFFVGHRLTLERNW